MNDLLIFDLYGVITSEEAYWDAAGLTLHELMYSPRYWDLNLVRFNSHQGDQRRVPIYRARTPTQEYVRVK